VAEVLVVVHQHRPEASALARDTVAWLEAQGHRVHLPHEDAVLLGRPDCGWRPTHTPAREAAEGNGFDLALSLGGDGTMLRTVDLVARADVPVLGVHVGQLGYLVEIEPADLKPSVEAFFSGRYEIEERMRLQARVQGDHRHGEALNEAVLEKTPLGHTVRLRVDIDGQHFLTYTADGLIVATPTGSTAYALSARAPIVAPGHTALVLTPVAAHSLFDRSLVLRPDSEVRIEVVSYRPARLFLDGRDLATLEEGQAVVCTASPHPARLVSFQPRNFLAILKSKFDLNER
jgi:NAD+ kinase